MTLLVTGSRGQLGGALLAAAAARGVPAEGHDLDTLDITDPVAVERAVLRLRPSAIVNCAAMTDVDRCESEPDAATRINGLAVGNLARAADLAGATLVQISTDYVFPGTGANPWREDDPVDPVNAYGRSKALGESLARTARRHLVVRTAWLFGPGGRNFVEAILGRIAGGATALDVVDDQRGCPTYAPDLAEAILDLLERNARGVVHGVNDGATTWFGFARAIAARAAPEVEIRPVPTSAVPRPARRPANSVLATERLRALLGRSLPPWEDALDRYLEARCAS